MQWVNKICDKKNSNRVHLDSRFLQLTCRLGTLLCKQAPLWDFTQGSLCVYSCAIERFLINMQNLIIQKLSIRRFFSAHNCESLFSFSSFLKPRMSSLQIIALSYASFPLSWCNENFDLLQSFHPITTRLCNPNYRAVL